MPDAANLGRFDGGVSSSAAAASSQICVSLPAETLDGAARFFAFRGGARAISSRPRGLALDSGISGADCCFPGAYFGALVPAGCFFREDLHAP